MNVKPLTDEEVSLWYCEQCRASGVLSVFGADAYSVVNAIEGAHKNASRDCGVSVGRVRIARPNDWFQNLAPGARPMEWRVAYENLYPGLGWRETTDPGFGGFTQRLVADELAERLRMEPRKYRSIRIEQRPVPDEWEQVDG